MCVCGRGVGTGPLAPLQEVKGGKCHKVHLFGVFTLSNLYIIGRMENSYTRKVRKKIRAPGENRTYDRPSSCSDALTTQLLEALWRAGSKFNYNYTSHRSEDCNGDSLKIGR